MSGRDVTAPDAQAYAVYLIRGQQVVLDSAVATGFAVETKRINEAVARNPWKFDERHVFQLTTEEAHALRSQSATSKPGRGGARHLPNVFTAKGVARLATILDSEEALRATDLIIDTFLQVQSQVAGGSSQVGIAQPSRLRPPTDDPLADNVRAKLAQAVTTLLDTVIDTAHNKTVRQVAADLGAGALEHLRERLRAKGLENTKLEADAMKAMAEAEKFYAEARKVHAEAEGLELDNIPKRIRVVKDLLALHRETEPVHLVQLLTDMSRLDPIPVRPGLAAPHSQDEPDDDDR